MSRAVRRVLLAAPLVVACSNLAALPAFSGLRESLVVDCCACLADSAVLVAGASCTPATIDDDGATVLPDDALTDEDLAKNFNEDPADDVDGVPCLCGASEDICASELLNGRTMQIPGACVDQVTAIAPCEAACGGVLSFEATSTQ